MRLSPFASLGFYLLASGCAAPPAPPPKALPPSSSATPAPALATWTPFDAPPPEGSTRALVRTGSRELRLDMADTRWLWKTGAEPVRSASFEAVPIQGLLLLENGTVAITEDGHALYSPDDVGPWQALAELPAGSDSGAISVYRGGVTVRARNGVGFLRAPRGSLDAGGAAAFEWLPPFEGRRPLDARVGADCTGLVVFSPQRLAKTTDCGKSYQALDDRGVYAESLLVDGDRVVTAPGGDHDVFARVFTPGAEKLERALVPADPHQPAARAEGNDSREVPTAKDLRRAIDTHSPLRTSPASWRSGSDHFVVSDGDRVFLGSHGIEFGSGTVGGAFTWSDREKRFPGCQYGPVGFSACGGIRVLSCVNAMFTWSEDGEPKPVEGSDSGNGHLSSLNVALQSPHDLFFTDGEGLWRLDLRKPKQRVLVSRADLSKNAPVRTRCDEAQRSPVWLGTALVLGAENAWTSAGEKDASVALELPKEFGRKPGVAGLARDGSLLVRDEKGGRIALVHEDGKSEERPSPVGDGPRPDALAFGEGGRGLAIDRASGRAFQSLDAGATWTPTRGPGRAIGKASIFCTATRCEVEGLFVRRGWDEVAPPDAGAANPSAHAGRALGATAPSVQCEASPAGAPRMPKGAFPDGLVPDFGPPGALWATMQVTSEKEGDELGVNGAMAQRSLFQLVGMADGRVTRTAAGGWKGTVPSTASMVLARDGVLFAWMDGHGLDGAVSAQAATLAALSAGDGLAPPRKVKGPFGEVAYAQGEFALESTPFVTASGLAAYNAHAHQVLWFDHDGALTVRNWPDSSLASDDKNAVALTAKPDGTWVALETSTHSMRVLSVAPDGVMQTRVLALAPQVEQGAGILANGADVDVALVEYDETGAPALRMHRLDDELRLGPPRTLPGTQSRDGALLPLAACAATLPTGAMDITRKVTVVVGGKTSSAVLTRRLRFDGNGACVDRTKLAGDAFSIVLRGLDGAGVMGGETPLTGARCKELR